MAAPQFEVDPFIFQELKQFFAAARANNWFPTWWAEPVVLRLSFSLIINEQNQIEDRLVNDPDKRYLGFFAGDTRKLIALFGFLGFTRLCFPIAKSETDPQPQSLLIYTVGDFTKLNDRINTGRDLFVGLFKDPQRRNLVQAWARANPVHHGTRVDYNTTYYSVDISTVLPGGLKYSPPLVEWKGQEPAWPLDPSKMPFYSNLHDPPIPLPVPVSARGAAQISQWLSPLATPAKPFPQRSLADLEEVAF